MKNLQNIFVDKINQFTIGKSVENDFFYVSFPVPTENRKSDYEVYYRIDFVSEPVDAIQIEKVGAYVDECRRGLHREKIISL